MKRYYPFLLLLVLLAGCGGELNSPGEELRLLAETLEPAFLGEPYSVNLRVSGGLSPYAYTLSEGPLPPGLELQGNTIRGTPTELGTYDFIVTVSDANLSKTFADYTLTVTEPPPPSLLLNVPTTEMRGPFRLRAAIEDARELQAFRTQLSWDPSRFEFVPGSVRSVRNGLVVFDAYDAEAGTVHIDAAVLGGSLSGDARLFELELRPLPDVVSTIEVMSETEFLSRENRFDFVGAREGAFPGSNVGFEDDEFEFEDDDPLDPGIDPDIDPEDDLNDPEDEEDTNGDS